MGTVAPSISPLEVSATVTEGAHPEQPATAADLAEARDRRRHGNDPHELMNLNDFLFLTVITRSFPAVSCPLEWAELHHLGGE